MRQLLLILFCLIAGAAEAASPTAPLDPVTARLVAEPASVAPGQTAWADLHLEIAPGWHVYWRNPGDSGLPTEIAWTLPPGFSAGAIAWPVPERFVTGTIGNYGYAGSADLLVPITVPPDAPTGQTAHLEAHATWLVCSEICIPGEKNLSLDLPVAAAAVSGDAPTAALFAAVRERLPKPAPFTAEFSQSGHELRLVVPQAALNGLANPKAAFFPDTPNVIDAAAEPRQQMRDGSLDLVLAAATGPTAKAPDALSGVLSLRDVGGTERAFNITVPRVAAAPAEDSADGSGIGWLRALGLAFLGGVILNLMPCVFPVLSLKLLGIAESTHRDEQRRHAAAYSAGVVVSFVVLGDLLLALREGGAAIGWGFQLQSPVVVALLAYLLLAMGLSLSGAAEFGSGLIGLGDRFAAHHGLAGAFATGVLATIVATPCTAPFMGAALGFALIAPVPVALAIFVALGCGLAAPVALASIVPGLARILPRPGAWMLWFKQILAFPLYATVAWLIWVLSQEVGPSGIFSALLGLVAVGFAVWVFGRTRFLDGVGRRVGSGFAAAGIIAALLIGASLSPAAPIPEAAAMSRDGLTYENFSAAKLARLEQQHRRVFVNLTAAWCLTCIVNERTTLQSAAVRQAFAAHDVVALKGDWTRQDPEITALLRKFGRSGVPLYVLYDRNGHPTVLPQILTEATVIDAVARL
jgi:thiol:disulfide interchange protein DsbD